MINPITRTLPSSLPTDSLISKMGLQTTKASWIFLEFLTRKDAQALRATSRAHKEQITPTQFVQIQLECRGFVWMYHIREYETLAKKHLVSSKIFHLFLNTIYCETDEEMVTTLNHFPNLEEITLPACNPTCLVNNRFNESLVFDKITTLNFVENYHGTDDYELGKFLKRFPNLQILNFVDNTLLTNIAFRGAIDQAPKLKTLSIEFSDRVTDPLQLTVQLTDGDLLHVATKCPDLQNLNIRGCKQITGAALRSVVHQLPKLIGLDAALCLNITGDDLLDIAKRRPLLQKLAVGGTPCKFTGQHLKNVSDILQDLTSLTILKCTTFTGGELRHIAAQCKKLQYLDLRESYLFSGEDLMYVAGTCKSLRTLLGPICGYDFTDSNPETGNNLKQDLETRLREYEGARTYHTEWAFAESFSG